MARLEFLEASRGAAADGGNTAEDGDAQQPEQQALEEELGFLHDLLQRWGHFTVILSPLVTLICIPLAF